MDETVKANWVAALESGEYKQTTGCLNNGKGMCCLGVLTDLYRKEHGGEWKATEYDYGVYFLSGIDSQSCVLPKEVTEWAKTDAWNPRVHFLTRTGEAPVDSPNSIPLAFLNDGGVPFNQIADLIKAFL